LQYQPGDSVGDYIVLGHLGSGAFGDVYRVEHSLTKRVEAMKVLPGPIAADRAERILREAKMQARLNHPNITALHNAFWWKGGLALVMELVEGEPLREQLAHQGIPIEKAIHYARQTLFALDHAHRHGVIHRDVSPANILITKGDRVKLTDFGLAKDPADRRITRAGSIQGSIYYSSPEQIRAADDMDQRADLYSFGVVLYEILTATKPFDGETAFDVMLAHAERTPPAPSTLNRGVPRWMDTLVLRALEKAPDQRYPTASAFLRALDAKARRGTPAWAYAAAAFAAITLLYSGLAVWRMSTAPLPLPPTMPSVAILVPPILPPPLEVSKAPEPEPAPPQQAVAAKPMVVRRKAASVPMQQPRIVGQEPAPPVYQAPATPAPEVPTEAPLQQAAAPQETPAIVKPAIPQPEPSLPPQRAEAPERPGRVRGLLNRVNPFRRRATPGSKQTLSASPQSSQ